MGASVAVALLAIAALAAGVLLGRYYVPDDRMLRRAARQGASHLRALNFILSRDRQGAVDELRRVVEENTDDVEPYFALGALFRSMGEWERAVRIHQAIELRAGDDRGVQLRILQELALDFRAAGMPRRAIRALEQYLDQNPKDGGALKTLASLYEEQGRFGESAQMWGRARKLAGDKESRREHHLFVAAAQRALEDGDADAAEKYLAEAEKAAPVSAHSLTARAEVAVLAGNAPDAVAATTKALSLAPQLAQFLIPALLEAESLRENSTNALADEGAEEWIAHGGNPAQRAVETILQSLAEQSAAPEFLALCAAEMSGDRAAARDILTAIIDQHPENLPANLALARLSLADTELSEKVYWRELLSAQGPLGFAVGGIWRCSMCAHRSLEFGWRCSACRNWGSCELMVRGADMVQAPSEPRERRATPRSAPLLPQGTLALPEPTLKEFKGEDQTPPRDSVFAKMGSALGGVLQRRREPRG